MPHRQGRFRRRSSTYGSADGDYGLDGEKSSLAPYSFTNSFDYWGDDQMVPSTPCSNQNGDTNYSPERRDLRQFVFTLDPLSTIKET